MRDKITISDVARIAGVSKRTVSRVLNNSSAVGQRSRQRVQDVIGELNYRPNALARGLASQKSYLLGMIYDETSAQNVVAAQRGMASICRDLGFELLVHPSDSRTAEWIDDAVSFVTRSAVDGVLMASSSSKSQELFGRLSKDGVPVVQLPPAVLGPARPGEGVQATSWAGVVTDYLRGLGHEEIYFLAGPGAVLSERAVSSDIRHVAAGSEPRAYPARLTTAAANSVQAGMESARELFRSTTPPSAVVASSDSLAIGVIAAARELGRRIPEDLSVCGFGDTPIAPQSMPPLTSVRLPLYEIAAQETARLIREIVGEDVEIANGAAPQAEIVVRASSGPAPGREAP